MKITDGDSELLQRHQARLNSLEMGYEDNGKQTRSGLPGTLGKH